MTYLAKVAADSKSYWTVFQIPCSVTKKLVVCAKKNHDVMMSLGLKGIQITGNFQYFVAMLYHLFLCFVDAS